MYRNQKYILVLLLIAFCSSAITSAPIQGITSPKSRVLDGSQNSNIVRTTLLLEPEDRSQFWGYFRVKVTISVEILPQDQREFDLVVSFPSGGWSTEISPKNLAVTSGSEHGQVLFHIVGLADRIVIERTTFFGPFTSFLFQNVFLFHNPLRYVHIYGLGEFEIQSRVLLRLPPQTVILFSPLVWSSTDSPDLKEGSSKTEVIDVSIVKITPFLFSLVAGLALTGLSLTWPRGKGLIKGALTHFGFGFLRNPVKSVRRILKEKDFESLALCCWLLLIVATVSLSFAVGSNPAISVFILSEDRSAMELKEAITGTQFERDVLVYLPQEFYVPRFSVFSRIGQVDLILIGDYPYSQSVFYELTQIQRLALHREANTEIYVLEEFESSPLSKAILGAGLGTRTVSQFRLQGIIHSIIARYGSGRSALSFETFGFVVVLIEVIFHLGMFFAALFFVLSSLKIKGTRIEETVARGTFLLLSVFFISVGTAVFSSYGLRLLLFYHSAPFGGVGNRLLGTGFLGLGGGTTLRFIAGFLGSSFALLLSHLKDEVKIDFSLVGMILGLGVISACLPITGRVFVELVIAFFTSETGRALEFTYIAANVFSYILTMGAIASVSRGMVMFYAGIGFSALPRVGKKLRSIFAIILVFLFARGFSRIGDFNGWIYISSSIPGVIFSIALILAMICLDKVVSFAKVKVLDHFLRRKLLLQAKRG